MKMIFRFVTAFVLAVSAYGLAFGVTPADIFGKMKQDRKAQEQTIKDMVKVETIEGSFGPRSSETTTYTKGGKSRTEVKMTAGAKEITMITICDGQDYWTISGGTKRKAASSNYAEKIKKDAQAQVDQYNNENSKITGTEMIEGRLCYVIESVYKDKDGKQYKIRMWIDKEKQIPYQSAFLDQYGKEAMKTIMSDYRVVYGTIQMPFKTEYNVVSANMTTKTITKSIKVNQGLSDDLFDTSKYKEISMTQMLFGQSADNQTGAATSSGTVNDPGTVNNATSPVQQSGKSSFKNTLKNSLKSKFMPF